MPPGEIPPELFWAPWLGHWCHVRPEHIGDMTPQQLHECLLFVERSQRKK